MIEVGGLGSRRGVLLGTAVLLFINQYYLQSGPARLIAIAFLMLLVTLFTRRGLVGIPDQFNEWLAERRARGGPQTAPQAKEALALTPRARPPLGWHGALLPPG